MLLNMFGLFGGIILCFIVIYLIYFACRKGEASETDRIEKESFLEKTVDNAIDKMIALLYGKIGMPFGDLLLSDEEIQFCINHCFNQDSILLLVKRIMTHLKMPYVIDVKVVVDNSKKNKQAGYYEHDLIHSKITIVLDEDYSFEQIIAIVCHECTHHFLFFKGIFLDDNEQNEIMTDVATVYLGFYKYMAQGYDIWESTNINEKTDCTRRIKVGYIDVWKVDYVYSVIKELRRGTPINDIHKSSYEKDWLKDNIKIKKMIDCDLENLNKVIEKNKKSLMLLAEKKSVILNSEEFQIIQMNMKNIEDDIYGQRYRKLANELNEPIEQSHKELQELHNRIFALTIEVTNLTAIVSKYL